MRQVILHCIKQFPKEACAVQVGDKYFPCENVSEDPLNAFRISPEQLAEIEDEHGPITGVVHSHPNGPACFSPTDVVVCNHMGVPWTLLVLSESDQGVYLQDTLVMQPSGDKNSLVGRPFVHGISDCLSIILDTYLRELGLDLGDYDREFGWWDQGKDYYQELLPKAGFRKVDTLQKWDVVLMQIRSPVPNHAAVYLGDDGTLSSEPNLYPTPGSILHHLVGRDSKRDVYGGYWSDVTVSYWRHKDVG